MAQIKIFVHVHNDTGAQEYDNSSPDIRPR